MDTMENLFKNPSKEYRGKPFWSWNGKLEKDELLRQIENLKEMGMGGYFCHSRIGLITEYLGDEWFDLINACADKGEQADMETWLYDEDRWPSGIAGGMVTENPAYRMKYIRLTICKGEDCTFTKGTIAAFTVNLDGFAFTDKKRLNPDEDAAGKTVLKFTIEEMAKDSFYNGFTYVDTMNPEATDLFIKLTHEKYKQKCGDRIGTSIQGIFTDEPHRGAVMCSFGVTNEGADYMTPYTSSLFADFQKTYGYDLVDFLPELFLWKDGQKINPVKWQYMELIQELFAEHFLKPIQTWCHQNNMKFTGHILHEDSLTMQTCMLGSVMRAYEHMDIPGVDVLSEHNYGFWIVKQLQSAARQLGKHWMLSELYGCTGWQFDFESHKAVGDWQALYGINLRCHHLSWVSMQGEAKRDYPASISGQSAWYKEYHSVEDYFSRLHVLLKQGEPLCDTVVVYPVESAWSLIYPRWSWQLGTEDEDMRRIEGIYGATFRMLSAAKLDFDYGDEDYIKRMGRVEIQDGMPVLRIGKCSYKSVLVTGMLTMRSSTLKLLEEFVKLGGNVVFGGELPQYIDALPSDQAVKIGAVYTDFDTMLDALAAKPFVTVRDAEGNRIDDIYVQIRKNGEDFIAVLMNINRQTAFKNVEVTFGTAGFCEKWDVKTGVVSLLAKGDPITFTTDFEPIGELAVLLTKKDNGYAIEKKQQNISKTIPLGNSFHYRLHEKNVCVLDFADFRINQGEWVQNTEILKVDRSIRSQFDLAFRGGSMLQPWFAGKTEQPVFCSLDMEFRFVIENIPESIQLAVETPDDFTILVNGIPNMLQKTNDFWVDSCFHIFNIDKCALKYGENVIRLSCNYRNDSNLEAIYLLGDFGVTLDHNNATLKKLPEKLTVGDIAQQGLPFYGAGISYHVKIPDEVTGNAVLHTNDFEAACIKVTDGVTEKLIIAKPYSADITGMNNEIEIQYILTRRNTFGPLHFAPLVSGSYGPEHFTTEGDLFLYDSYGLLPEGMVSPVSIDVFEG